jgi:hypothetical protein
MTVLVKIDPRDFQTLATNRNRADMRVRGRTSAKPSVQPSNTNPHPGERAYLWALKKNGGTGLAQRGRILSFVPIGYDYRAQVHVDERSPSAHLRKAI